MCPAHLTGKNCRYYASYDDLVVKVLNKGIYLAQVTLYYKRAFSNGEYIKEIGNKIIKINSLLFKPKFSLKIN